MIRTARPLAAAVAGVLAVLALAVGGVLAYLDDQVIDRDAFQQRAVAALRQDAVRRLVADRIVTEAIRRGEPDLVTARPLLTTVASSVIASQPFTVVLRLAAADAHRLLFDEERDTVPVELADLAALVASAVRGVDPRLARALPARLDVRLASLTPGSVAGGVPRVADHVRALAVWLPLLGLVLVGLALLLARRRRRAVVWLGTGGVAAGVIVAVLTEARPRTSVPLGNLTVAQTDAALAQTWWAFAGDLQTLALIVAAGCGLVSMVAAWNAPLPAGWRAWVAGRLSRDAHPAGRVRRALILLALAAGLVLAATVAGTLLAIALAVLLVLVAADELLGARAARREAGATAPARRPARQLLVLAAVVLLAIGGGVAARLLTRDVRDVPLGGGAAGVSAGETAGCNGSVTACAMRLGDVTFPGTHNAMSAIAHPGWVFTNQRYDVGRQLDDGIRFLLLDLHWGRRDGDRVRTDLAREGSSRNRVARALGPTRTRTAERLAGDIGLGSARGRDAVYLCHTLCELGATPVQETLATIRRFLDAHPRDLLVLSLESSISAGAVEAAFTTAGLVPRIAVLDRDRPLPVLRELLDAHRQLVVFVDRDAGTVPWLLPAEAFVQDTPIGGDGCARRTGDPSAPFLQINQWIDAFPPRPSASRRIGTAARLTARLDRCTRERGIAGALLAVDYHDQTAVVSVARRRNGP